MAKNHAMLNTIISDIDFNFKSIQTLRENMAFNPEKLDDPYNTISHHLLKLKNFKSELSGFLNSPQYGDKKDLILKTISKLDKKIEFSTSLKNKYPSPPSTQKESIAFINQMVDQIDLIKKINDSKILSRNITENSRHAFTANSSNDVKLVSERCNWHKDCMRRLLKLVENEEIDGKEILKDRNHIELMIRHLADADYSLDDDFYSSFFSVDNKRNTYSDEKFQEKNKISDYELFKNSMQQLPLISNDKRTYEPKNPCDTPEFFPKTYYHERTIEEFSKLDIETFFFIFYFQQGTKEQMLASKILKRNSWRFHKYFLTWFQRSKEPDVTEESMEKGSYIYFDYDSSWCYRNKDNFTFDYKFLENEL